MGGGHGWLADRSQTTAIEYDKPKKNDVHPTMKPVEMLCYFAATQGNVSMTECHYIMKS